MLPTEATDFEENVLLKLERSKLPMEAKMMSWQKLQLLSKNFLWAYKNVYGELFI
jgi:hypothetical protein